MIRCGICNSTDVVEHCTAEQCKWSRCNECRSYGVAGGIWVKKPKP